MEPLGKVINGYGNNGEDKTAGASYQNAIATYPHRPLMPKNPFIARLANQESLAKQIRAGDIRGRSMIP